MIKLLLQSLMLAALHTYSSLEAQKFTDCPKNVTRFFSSEMMASSPSWWTGRRSRYQILECHSFQTLFSI